MAMGLELVNADKILEQLTCNNCHKFLSVSPIKVYPNREIKCGRCSRNDNEGVISLFDTLASQFLFKCVNRFDGCRKLLRTDQVEEHERNCLGGKYFCPLCPPESLELPTYLLMTHFKKEHKDNILQQPWVLVKLGESSEVNKLFLYSVDDNLFFVTCKFDLSNGSIFLSSIYVGTAEKAQKMVQRYSLYSKDFKSLLKSDRKSCDYVGSCPVGVVVRVTEIQSVECMVLIELDLQRAELFKIPFSDVSQYAHSSKYGQLRKIFLSPDFLESHPNYSIDSTGSALVITHDDTKMIVTMQCCVCFEMLNTLKYFFSDESGGKSFCKICVEYYKVKEPDTKISKFSLPEELRRNIKIYCKWKCNTLISSQIILMRHEEYCLRQTLKACPMLHCIFKGNSCDLQLHFQEKHSDVNLYLSSTWTRNTYDPQKPNISYLLMHDEFVVVSGYSFDTLKSPIFTIDHCNRKLINDELQLAVIVYDDYGDIYLGTFRKIFTLPENFLSKFKIVSEKVPAKIFCGSG